MIYANYEQFRNGFATSSTLDITGRKVWPAANLQTAFSFVFPGTAVDNPLGEPILVSSATYVQDTLVNGATFPWRFTMNGLQADASVGVDLYDWYCSQHTDDPTKQYLSLERIEGEVGFPWSSTYSGTVLMRMTALGTSTFGSTLTPAQLSRLTDHAYVYTQRRSDDRIWMFDLRKMLFTPTLPS